ncbi:hypothetical protein BD560DRAFT_197126 [Blakeslea trispora]|nr:hypothetical protein BD560DRAFT_197126 [Blakeslea trispora]
MVKPASLKRGRPLQQKPTAEAKSTKKTSSNKPASSRHTSDEKLYCLCRQPYDVARFMIACDRCDDWFHGECIGIKETESEFIDLYYCDSCSKATGKETSWKPKCSNPNCFKAARISLSTGHLSKYCSDSCGLQVARARIELVEIKRRQNLQGQRISIEHLALQKHKQLHIHSLADRQNRQRLLEIRQEKLDIKDRLIQIGKRIDLLSLSQTTSECGFDPKLIDSNGDICRSTACSRHEDWSNILFLRLGREKKEEYDNLIRVEEERKRIKTLMQKRRSDKDIRERLTNMTYSF